MMESSFVIEPMSSMTTIVLERLFAIMGYIRCVLVEEVLRQ
jgi:hypothetical protein